MRKLGKIIHFTNRGLVLRAERVPKLGGSVCNKAGARVGSVFDLFGPVAEPYVVIKPARGTSRAELEKLIGSDIYMGERYGKGRKAEKVSRVRKRKARA